MKILGFYITRKQDRCSDCQKYKSNFKQIHDQLRAEVYSEPQPSDNCCVGNYDDIKKASEK